MNDLEKTPIQSVPAAAVDDSSTQKLPWQAPVIEVFDAVTVTQAGLGGADPADFGTYRS